jgi:antitoxin component YwqK of YwqJK toxin-antitoxin module
MSRVKFLLATFVIAFAFDANFAQQRPIPVRPARPGTVRTIRTEKRQLRAVTYHQAGVMVTTAILDDKGRLLEGADYLPGGNPDTKSTTTYDKNGNAIEYASYIHDELSSRSTVRYDRRNRKIEQLNFDGNGKPRNKFVFQYDSRGRQNAFEVQPDGERVRRSVATLDSRGHELERVEYDHNGKREGHYVFRYSNAGKLLSETHYYTQNGKTSSSKTTYVYDRNGHVLELSLYFDDVLEKRTTYKRDARSHPIEVIETDGKQRVVEKQTWSYEFNSAGDFTRAIVSEWTDKAPDVQLQPTFEYRRVFGSVNTATVALWRAARESDAARIAVLLKQGADVNAHHPDGGTPLIKAAARSNRNVVQALLAGGAKVDERDTEGWTALMWAAEYGKLETVDALLKAGANPNARNEAGVVAIMTVTLNGHIEVLKLLLEKGADANAHAFDGATALMFAAEEGNVAVLKLLLDSGANVNAKSKDGQTALSIAVAANKNEAAELLRKAGAK